MHAEKLELTDYKKRPFAGPLYWALVYMMMPETGVTFPHDALLSNMIMHVVTAVCLSCSFQLRPE